mgnify:CR=1 FL=1
MDVFLLQVSMDLLGGQSIINGDCSCIFPYMANNVLRSATGHGRGKRDISGIKRLIRWRFQPLRHFVTPPLLLTPHPVMLRGTAMEEFKILKVLFNPPPLPHSAIWRVVLNNIGAEAKGIYISPSPPVFCAAKYRGSARRAKGLIQTKTSLPNTSPLFGDEDARK